MRELGHLPGSPWPYSSYEPATHQLASGIGISAVHARRCHAVGALQQVERRARGRLYAHEFFESERSGRGFPGTVPGWDKPRSVLRTHRAGADATIFSTDIDAAPYLLGLAQPQPTP